MDNTDLISVIIPTYNRAHLIKRSVESVLNQTYKNLELIIVDDGSTDNTKEIIDSINDKRIIYVKQQNQGACAARNNGIDLAKGKYIAFQDSDDIWHLNKLEIQIQKLKENNADIVFCKMFMHGNLLKRKTPKFFNEGFLGKDTLTYSIGPQTILAKKEVFINNKFDTSMPRLQDVEVLLRIKKAYSIYCIDKPLVDYYIQKDSISENPEKLLKAWKILLGKNKNFIKDYSSSSEYLASIIFYQVFKTKDKKTRKELLDLAFMFNNSYKIKIKYLCHKFYLYKIRGLMYNAVSIPTRNIIKLFRKVI